MKERFARFSSAGRYFAVLVLPFLAACEEQLDLPPPAVKEVTTFTVANPQNDSVRNMSARLAASQRVELSFRVPGKVVELLVKEGDEVSEGQILASLDQSEFKNALADRQAAFESATADYERAKVLIVEEAMSKRDYDAVVAQFRIARAAYDQAKVDLQYTVLRAPFDGEVSTRSIENFEEVAAGEQIFYMTDTSRMDVKISVPESVMLMVRKSGSTERDDAVSVYLKLADRPGEAFEMQFREAAQRADPETKTYEVTYQIDQIPGLTLLPGMTASAQVEFHDFTQGQFRVPSRVVFGDIYMRPRVWVLDEAAGTVTSREVTIGRSAGRSLTITSGVQPGDRLVSSHVAFLREGEVVTTDDASQAI